MNPRIIARKLRVLYDALDPATEAALEEYKKQGGTAPSCREGCAGCCHQMTGITIPEGLVLAKAALEREDWRELATRMRDACAPLLKPITRRDYFRKAIPCAFLDVPTQRCTAYTARPGACRFHYVITPPEDCFPSAGSKGTRALNLLAIERYVWEFNDQNMGAAAAAGAPIQLTTLWCMWLLAEGDDKTWLDELKAGVPDPNAWTLWALVEGGVPDLTSDLDSDEKRAVRALLQK